MILLSKYRCPRCGSTNLCLSEQTVTEKKYKFTKDGRRYKQPFLTMYDVADCIENIECMNCLESCNLMDKDNIKEWEVNNENP